MTVLVAVCGLVSFILAILTLLFDASRLAAAVSWFMFMGMIPYTFDVDTTPYKVLAFLYVLLMTICFTLFEVTH